MDLEFGETRRRFFEETGSYGALLDALSDCRSHNKCPKWFADALELTLLGWMFGSSFVLKTGRPVPLPPQWFRRWCKDQVDFWRAYCVEEGRVMGLTEKDARGYATLLLSGLSLNGRHKLPAGGDSETMKKSYHRVRALVRRGEDYRFHTPHGLEYVAGPLAAMRAYHVVDVRLAYVDRMHPNPKFVVEVNLDTDVPTAQQYVVDALRKWSRELSLTKNAARCRRVKLLKERIHLASSS